MTTPTIEHRIAAESIMRSNNFEAVANLADHEICERLHDDEYNDDDDWLAHYLAADPDFAAHQFIDHTKVVR